MKKIFTLAIIALTTTAMVSCCGTNEKKCDEQAQQTAVENCDKNCAECEKKDECPAAATEAPATETPATEASATEAAPAAEAAPATEAAPAK